MSAETISPRSSVPTCPYYEGYGLFIGLFDEAQVLRLGGHDELNADKIRRVRREFKDNCLHYSRLTEKLDAGVPENGSSFLSPVFASSFGHYDEIAFTLIDDLTDFSYLTSCSPELETYSLSLCPSLRHFLECGEADTPFESAPYLFGADVPTKHPLVAVTTLKLNGFCSLRYGLSMQAAAVEFVIDAVTDALRECANNSFEPHTLTDPESFNRARVLIADPLSVDDIVLVTLCDDYTVAGAIMATLRGATFGSLVDSSRQTESQLASVAYRRSVAEELTDGITTISSTSTKKFSTLLGGSEEIPASRLPELRAMSLFASTCTTLGLTTHITDAGSIAVGGRVSVHGVADISPGGERDAESRISSLSVGEPVVAGNDADRGSRLVLTGRHDLEFRQVNGCMDLALPLEPTKNVVAALSQLVSGNKDGNPIGSSEILDVSTSLAIPIPECITCELRVNGATAAGCSTAGASGYRHSDRFPVLARLDEFRSDVIERLGIDRNPTFDECMRTLALPASSRAIILRCFWDFSNSIGDPLLFDTSLDLLDVFIAFSDYMSEMSKRLLRWSDEDDRIIASRAPRLFAMAFAKDLSTALSARLGPSGAHNESYFGHWDGRAAVSDFFTAGDAVAKCVHGLIRHSEFGSESSESSHRRSLTAVLSAHTSTLATAEMSSLRSARVNLISVRMDTAHLFRLRHLVSVVHELAHQWFAGCVCETGADLLSKAQDLGMPLDDREVPRVLQELSECAAEMVVRGYVLTGSPEQYERYAFLTLRSVIHEFSRDSYWEGDGILRAFFNAVRQTFVVERCVAAFEEGEGVSALPDELDAEKYVDALIATTKRWGKTIPVVRRLGQKDLEGMAREMATETYQTARIACQVLSSEIAQLLSDSKAVFGEDRQGCEAWVRMCFESGVPVGVWPSASSREYDESAVCLSVVGVYVKELLNSVFCDDHDGRAKFDSGDGSIRWDSPESRKRHFIYHASAQKSLWHISCKQRLRRLIDPRING